MKPKDCEKQMSRGYLELKSGNKVELDIMGDNGRFINQPKNQENG